VITFLRRGGATERIVLRDYPFLEVAHAY
jgi:hypothetical protein